MALLLSGLGQGNGGGGSHWFGAEVLSPVWTHSVRDASEKSESQHLVGSGSYGTRAQQEDRTTEKRSEKLQCRGDG